MITISEKTYDSGFWTVVCVIDGNKGTFVGPFVLELPETATEAEIIAAISEIIEG
jgi:hypothetical protein